MIARTACVRVVGGLAAAALWVAGAGAVLGDPTVDRPASGRAAPAYTASGLYNLGNAYARAGKPGLAVLNYERAALLAPGDPDIEANVAQVRAAARVPPPGRSGFARAATRAVAWAPPTVIAWIGVAGILLVGLAVLGARWGTRGRKGAGAYGGARRRVACVAGIVAGAVLIGLTVVHAVVVWPSLHEAVVITASAPVRVSPVPMGEPVFELHDAETVEMQARHEGFELVRTRGGRTGWVALANLAPVVPCDWDCASRTAR